MTDWTPERIKKLREKRGQSQTEFGLEIWSTTPNHAQRLVSDIERGERGVRVAEMRTLERMAAGEL